MPGRITSHLSSRLWSDGVNSCCFCCFVLRRHHHGDVFGALRLGVDQHSLRVVFFVGHWRIANRAVLACGPILLLFLWPNHVLFHLAGQYFARCATFSCICVEQFTSLITPSPPYTHVCKPRLLQRLSFSPLSMFSTLLCLFLLCYSIFLCAYIHFFLRLFSLQLSFAVLGDFFGAGYRRRRLVRHGGRLAAIRVRRTATARRRFRRMVPPPFGDLLFADHAGGLQYLVHHLNGVHQHRDLAHHAHQCFRSLRDHLHHFELLVRDYSHPTCHSNPPKVLRRLHAHWLLQRLLLLHAPRWRAPSVPLLHRSARRKQSRRRPQ